MPHYSYLATDLNCPACGDQVSDIVYFQWGFSPGYAPRDEYVYRVGDSIRWQKTKEGSVLPWVYFYHRDGEAITVQGANLGDPSIRRDGETITVQGANLGDPAIHNLLVRDTAQFFWEEPEKRRRCQRCNTVVEGAIIEIRDGIIRGARIYLPDEYSNHAAIYIIDPTGTLKPMPEWDDYPMGAVYNLLRDQLQ